MWGSRHWLVGEGLRCMLGIHHSGSCRLARREVHVRWPSGWFISVEIKWAYASSRWQALPPESDYMEKALFHITLEHRKMAQPWYWITYSHIYAHRYMLICIYIYIYIYIYYMYVYKSNLSNRTHPQIDHLPISIDLFGYQTITPKDILSP